MFDSYGGRVTVQTICRKTGKILDQYGPENNSIVDEGVEQIWLRLSTNDSGNGAAINSIAVGTDFGDPQNWTEFNPAPPSRDLVAEDQNVIYFTPFANMSFEYPVKNILKVTGLIDGVDAMTQSFPTQATADFTSATLRSGSGRVIAYKRFPARYISRDVDIRVVWTLTMQNAATFCGFSEPEDDGNTIIYFGSQIQIDRLDADGNKEYDFTHHDDNVSQIAADIAGFIYSADESGKLIKQDSNRNIRWEDTSNNGFDITGIAYDHMGNIYTSSSASFLKKFTEYGDQIWSVDPQSQLAVLTGVDSALGVYYYDNQDLSVRKLTPAGNEAWAEEDTHDVAIIAATTDNDGFTFTIDINDVLRLFNEDGDFMWDVQLSVTPTCISQDPTGGVVLGFGTNLIEKYDLNGNVVWSDTVVDAASTHITVDNDGSVYVATQNQKVHKINNQGILQWSYDSILSPVTALAVNRN